MINIDIEFLAIESLQGSGYCPVCFAEENKKHLAHRKALSDEYGVTPVNEWVGSWQENQWVEISKTLSINASIKVGANGVVTLTSRVYCIYCDFEYEINKTENALLSSGAHDEQR